MFAQTLMESVGVLKTFLDEVAADQELSDSDLHAFIDCLDEIKTAVEYELACREEACTTAATQGREARTEI